MKRLSIYILALSLVICFIPFTAQATETTTNIQYFEDGSYLITEIVVSNTRSITKVAHKNDTYYSSTDVPQWKISVTGEFLYDGTTSTCTYATGTCTIYVTSDWAFISESSSANGNTATYYATISKQVFGINIDPRTHSVSVTCDENGNCY